MSDRRRTGVNEVIFEDDNGQTMKFLSANSKTPQTIVALVVGIFTIIGGVYIAVQKGVNVEIEDAVEEMVVDEHSGLHREIRDIAEEEAEMVAGAFQDDLDVFEREQKEQGKAIARIETQQTAFEKKMDNDKRDIIDEIRREREGGG